MRQRFKTTGLVSHTTPTHSIVSEESKLRSKFKKGNITKEELRKLASFMTILKNKSIITYTQVKIMGKWEPLTKYDYNIEILLSQGFTLR